MTYNQVVNLFSNISSAHEQIQLFGAGEVYDVDSFVKNNKSYPCLWLSLVSVQEFPSVKMWNLRLLCFDLLHIDFTNETDVWSDTEQILCDVVKILKDPDISELFYLKNDPILLPFSKDGTDLFSGWRCDITLETDTTTFCSIPVEDILLPNVINCP